MKLSIKYDMPELEEILTEILQENPRYFLLRVLHEVHRTLEIKEPGTIHIFIIPDSKAKKYEGWVQDGMPMVIRTSQDKDTLGTTVAHEYIHRRFPQLPEGDVERIAQEVMDQMGKSYEEVIHL